MYLELLGLSAVKIQSGDTVILLAPQGKNSEIRSSRMKADVVVLGSTADKINVEPRTEKLFTIAQAGEYESSGIFVYCLKHANGAEASSLISRVTLEGMTIAHLGSLAKELSQDQLELFKNVDVLFVPVGGAKVLDAKKAAQVVESIEPRVVIPMHTALKGLKTKYDTADAFFKIVGSTPKPMERLKLLKKELPLETMDVYHLEP
jgi:L-ascorbate metabolism protein UlaG (beta-lactamase superfamily)